MTTNTAGSAARQDPRNVSNTIEKTVNYNDSGIAAGFKIGTLPAGAFLVGVFVEVITAFNAGSNVLTVGGSSSFNELVAAADVNEAAAAVTAVTRGLGRSFAASADTDVHVKYVAGGATPSAGQAKIVIVFTGGWST